MRRRARLAGRAGGQASVEVVALLPLLVLVALLGWQLAALAQAGVRADGAARERALAAHGAGRIATVTVDEPVARFLPGLPALRVPARLGVRTP